jgi:hypothetical protein
MPWVRLELTIPASDQAKRFQSLDSAATVTGLLFVYLLFTNDTLIISEAGKEKWKVVIEKWIRGDKDRIGIVLRYYPNISLDGQR